MRYIGKTLADIDWVQIALFSGPKDRAAPPEPPSTMPAGKRKDYSMQSDIRAGLVGSLAGGLATIPMTAFMLLARRLGFLGEEPPRLITDYALDAAGLSVDDRNTETAITGAVHFGFGIVCGALFGAFSRRVRLPFLRVATGTLYGLAIWFVSYNGWVPALHIMPPPEEDRPGRPTAMILAHVIYGSVLGWVVEHADGSSPS